jgi:hypothetical protein
MATTVQCCQPGCDRLVVVKDSFTHIARCITVAASDGDKSVDFWVGFLDVGRECSAQYVNSSEYNRGMMARSIIGLLDRDPTDSQGHLANIQQYASRISRSAEELTE